MIRCVKTNRADKPASPPPACLVRPAKPDRKGFTLLADGVCCLDAHARRLADPDGYRPSRCPRCAHDKLHVHDYPSRALRGNRDAPSIRVVRYRCASCDVTFRVLPAFVARHLWRCFHTIEQETIATHPSPSRPPIPERTAQRWRARLASQIGPLHEALAHEKHPLANEVLPDQPRRELVLAHAQLHDASPNLMNAAMLVHQIDPKLRLI